MLQDIEKHEKYSKMAIEGERQYKRDMEKANKELASTEFRPMSAPDFEKFEEMERAQHQAPLDILAELKAINQRLDAEHDDRKMSEKEQQHIERTRFWITFVVTLIGSVAAVGGLIATIALR